MRACVQVEAEADLVAGRAQRAQAEESKLAGMRAALHALEIEVRTAHQEVAAANMRYGQGKGAHGGIRKGEEPARPTLA